MSNAVPRQTLSTLGWLGLLAVGIICLSAGCSKSDENAQDGGSAEIRSCGRKRGYGRG